MQMQTEWEGQTVTICSIDPTQAIRQALHFQTNHFNGNDKILNKMATDTAE